MNRFSATTLLLFLCLPTQIQAQQRADQSYLYGRDYYVLRSGRAKMVIQCDKADVGPAFTYLLFDAVETSQSSRKDKAFNYAPPRGYSSSALEVLLNNFSFTALGHNTTTRWITENGIPSVEAVWWASGIKVCEIVSPVSLNGVFKRTITLEAADLVAEEYPILRLSLHAPAVLAENNVLIYDNKKSSIALTVERNAPAKISPSKDALEIGPIQLQPGEKKVIESYLFVKIPSEDIRSLSAKVESVEKWIQNDLQAALDRWKKSNVISTQDKAVQSMYDNCRFTLPAYISDNGKMDAGIFEYGAQWVRDSSNTALGIIHVGEFELARAVLDHMLKDMILENGTTMIAGGFDDPDREQFDQMGEFMHVMKSYVDWTGDVSLLIENRNKLIAMIERPLHPNFRNSTGMVHNRREFWERTFEDAYELAYQTWVIEGLRDAADLSVYLQAQSKAGQWRQEADRILIAMLNHPQMKLVDNGHLIKRRSTTGEVVDQLKFQGWMEGAPAKVESLSRLMPDATMALPIALNLIDPKSPLSKKTLDELEGLWNERWFAGGYERYHSSSQGDQPGPWTFATTFVMRAQHEAGLMDMSRRSFEWLYSSAGGRTGAWFEEVPLIRSQAFSSGLIPWTTAEVSYFIVHHLLGVKFVGNRMVIKPALYPSSPPIQADFRYRKARIRIEIDGSGLVTNAMVDGKVISPNKNGAIELPLSFAGGDVKIFTGKK
jgi:hypothetical protein